MFGWKQSAVEDYADSFVAYVSAGILGCLVVANREHISDISNDSSIQTGAIVMIIWVVGARAVALLDKIAAQKSAA